MKYQISTLVTILKTNEIKKIVDFEKFDAINLYYMSDLTAYPEEEISEFTEEPSNLINEKIKNLYLSKDIYKKMAQNACKILKNYI